MPIWWPGPVPVGPCSTKASRTGRSSGPHRRCWVTARSGHVPTSCAWRLPGCPRRNSSYPSWCGWPADDPRLWPECSSTVLGPDRSRVDLGGRRFVGMILGVIGPLLRRAVAGGWAAPLDERHRRPRGGTAAEPRPFAGHLASSVVPRGLGTVTLIRSASLAQLGEPAGHRGVAHRLLQAEQDVGRVATRARRPGRSPLHRARHGPLGVAVPSHASPPVVDDRTPPPILNRRAPPRKAVPTTVPFGAVPRLCRTIGVQGRTPIGGPAAAAGSARSTR